MQKEFNIKLCTLWWSILFRAVSTNWLATTSLLLCLNAVSLLNFWQNVEINNALVSLFFLFSRALINVDESKIVKKSLAIKETRNPLVKLKRYFMGYFYFESCKKYKLLIESGSKTRAFIAIRKIFESFLRATKLAKMLWNFLFISKTHQMLL